MKIPNKNYLKALLQKMIAVKIFDQVIINPQRKALGNGYVTISKRVQGQYAENSL